MKSLFTKLLLVGALLAGPLFGQGVGGNSVPRTSAGISNALDLLGSTQGTILYRNASGWVALPPGTSGQLLATSGAGANPSWVSATGGAGNVSSGAATDNAIARYDTTSGQTIQNSAVTIADITGSISINGTDTATAVNTGGMRSANFGLSTVSGGASYFGGAINSSSGATLGDLFTVRKDGAAAAFVNGVILDNRTTTGAILQYFSDDGANTSYTRLIRYGSTHATKPGVFEISQAGAGRVNITNATSASSSTAGALTVGDGTAATNVAIGGGNLNAGGTITGASLATGQTPSASVATASTHKVAIVLNGVTYYMLLTNVP